MVATNGGNIYRNGRVEPGLELEFENRTKILEVSNTASDVQKYTYQIPS